MIHRNVLGITSLLLSIGLGTFMSDTYAEAQRPVDFNLDIRPILADRCFHCHGPDAKTVKGDLRLDLEDAAKAEVISPGDIADSILIDRITSEDPKEVMPPPDGGKPTLNKEEIALVKRWIDEGAVWANHWAFEPPKEHPIPTVDKKYTANNPIDNFILSRLKDEGLEPAPEADRETLIRRAAFDLTGLPPTLEDIDTYLQDASSQAYSNMLDRLLASKHYGERMAIDWLDGARYADSNGFQNDFGRDMHPWRDWVIDTFNANMSFDQFTIEQIAGDMLPNATLSQKIATGFNRNHRSNTEGGTIEEEWRTENIVDRVETTGSVFLGLTLGCARCHDHKYDPFSQKEFYQFFSFFNHTEDRGVYNETRGNAGSVISLATAEQEKQLASFDAKIKAAQEAFKPIEKNINDNHANAQEQLIKAYGQPEVKPDYHQALKGDNPFSGLKANDVDWTDGLFGKTLEMRGTPESSLDLEQAHTFEHDKPFTISLWVQFKSNGPILTKADKTDQQKGFTLASTQRRELLITLANEKDKNAIRLKTTERLITGKWVHVALSYDGSSKAKGLKVYMNGVYVRSLIEQDTLTQSINSKTALRFGGGTFNNYFRGGLKDLRTFNRVLNENEILDTMIRALPVDTLDKLSEKDIASLNGIKDSRKNLQITLAREPLAQIERDKKAYTDSVNVPSVMVMIERKEPRKTYRLDRGVYDAADTSEELYSEIPAFLPQLPEGTPKNRLGLAQWLVSDDNPLTARVTVNRLWDKFFGQGIVSTLDNFGTQGAIPTHPEVLDWLALEFIRLDWDLKAIQKTIMMSATYRQNSDLRPELSAHDPNNILLARGPRFRLQAELIRDNALAASGLLVRDIGGPAVKPYQPDGMWMELAGGANQGPYVIAKGKDLYRRSLYTVRKRTVPHATMSTFDAPSFEVCYIKRARTNTPLQALALLNDTTYVEAARSLAQRMIQEGGNQPQKRIAHGFRLATGRYPTQRELNILTQGFTGYSDRFNANTKQAEEFLTPGASEPDQSIDRIQLAAYSAIAGVILNLDETITKE